MIPLQTLSDAHFESLLNEPFLTLNGPLENYELRLIEIIPFGLQSSNPGMRRGFSTIWRGPFQPPLQQGMWRLHNEALGYLDIFLVSIGPDQEGLCYEAIFN